MLTRIVTGPLATPPVRRFADDPEAYSDLRGRLSGLGLTVADGVVFSESTLRQIFELAKQDQAQRTADNAKAEADRVSRMSDRPVKKFSDDQVRNWDETARFNAQCGTALSPAKHAALKATPAGQQALARMRAAGR